MRGSWDLRRRTPALLQAQRAGSGAAELPESPSLAGKRTLKLSWKARRSVGASPGLCVGPGQAGAERGFSSLGARIEQRAWVSGRSGRRRAGSAVLRGDCASDGSIRDPVRSVPFPTGYPPSSWLRGCSGDTEGAERPARSLGLPGWASASASSGPKGAAAARSPGQFTLAGAARAAQAGGIPGRRWAARISRRGEQIIFCALIRKVGSLRGGMVP